MADVTAEAAAAPLDRARREADPVLRGAVGSLPPRLRSIAAYHLGWEDADGVPVSGPGGKAVRPALVLAAAKAVRRAERDSVSAGGEEKDRTEGHAAPVGGAEAPVLGAYADPAASGTRAPVPDATDATDGGRSGPAPGARAGSGPAQGPDERGGLERLLAVVRRDGTRGERLAAAAAVELAHNFTLLHDDVIDRDPTRRHRPTAWTVFGADNAILAGDALLALALRIPSAPAAAWLAEAVIEVCEGQFEDLAFERRDDVSLAECLAMAEKKTGALLGAACAMGALVVGAPPEAVAALDRYGREIGLAFQLVDDLLGIWGEPAVTGKPAGADLAARKKSLPVVAALATRSPAAAELAKLYGTGRDLTDGELRRAADAVERAGGRAWAQAEAERRASAARTLIAGYVDEARAADLYALADLITRRSH